MTCDERIKNALEELKAAGRAFVLVVRGPDGELHTWQGGEAPDADVYSTFPAVLYGLRRDAGRICWRGSLDQPDEESLPAEEVAVLCPWDGTKVPQATGYFGREGRLSVTYIPCPTCGGSGQGPEADALGDLEALGGDVAVHSLCYRCGGSGVWGTDPQ